MQSETSPNQGIPNQVPWLGLVSLFQIWDFCGYSLNTLKYPKNVNLLFFSCVRAFLQTGMTDFPSLSYTLSSKTLATPSHARNLKKVYCTHIGRGLPVYGHYRKYQRGIYYAKKSKQVIFRAYSMYTLSGMGSI